MDSSNLSVIFAPNLLHSADGAEKMNAGTEKKLKLQAAVLHCFIQNARDFGMMKACNAFCLVHLKWLVGLGRRVEGKPWSNKICQVVYSSFLFEVTETLSQEEV